MAEIKKIARCKSFVEGLSIFHLEIETNAGLNQNCFFGIVDEQADDLETLIKKIHPLTNSKTKYLEKILLPEKEYE